MRPIPILVALAILASTPSMAQITIGFETCAPGTGTLPCFSGWTSNGGTVNIVPDPGGTIVSPMFGFPTEGLACAIVTSAGASGFFVPPAAGGPAPYPFAAGSTGNVIFPAYTVPTPPPGYDLVLEFDYTYCTPECPADATYNDFFTVDLVDPTNGLPLLNVLYRDTFSSTLVSPVVTTDAQGLLTTGFCAGMEQEEGPAGVPKSVSMVISPTFHGAFANLEFHVGDATDNAYNGYIWLDRVEFRFVQSPLTVTLSSPSGAGSIQLDNSGLVPGLEVFNVITINEPCPGGVGTGPYLGLCTSDLNNLIVQVTLPVGAVPFHFVATSTTYTLGPIANVLPSGLVLEALCFNGANISPAVRHVIP